MYLGCLMPQILRKSSFVSPRCLKTSLMTPKGVPNEHLGHPRGSQNGPLVTLGGPKVDRNGSWDPFGTQVISRTVSGRRDRLEGLAFWALSDRTWSLQGPILDPRGGSPKGSKIDMGRQGRHLWRPRWAKRLFQRGSQNGVEKVIEKGSQNESF